MGCVKSKPSEVPAVPAAEPAAVAAKPEEKYEFKEEEKKEEVKAEASAKSDDEDEEEDDDADVVSESEFMKIDPSKAGKMRTSVSAEAYGEWNKKQAFTPPVHEKSDEQKTRLSDTLQKSFMFRALNKEEMNTVIMAMMEVKASAGEKLITLGDEGDFLFVIESGTLECRKDINGEDTLLKTVEEGDVFGELALLYNTVRAADVISKTDCALWKLDRQSFNHIVKDAAQKKRERYEGFLSKVPLLKEANMDNYERSQLCDGLQNETFSAGDSIIKEGEEGNTFYIIESGTATAYKSGEKVMDYESGAFFGELALLHNAPRAATVVAESEVQCLVLDRGAFKRLFGGSAKLIEEFKKKSSEY